jgi:hypothetical protein
VGSSTSIATRPEPTPRFLTTVIERHNLTSWELSANGRLIRIGLSRLGVLVVVLERGLADGLVGVTGSA